MLAMSYAGLLGMAARPLDVSNAVRISANRFYVKGHGKTSGDELRHCQRSVDQAFKAHPLACKSL